MASSTSWFARSTSSRSSNRSPLLSRSDAHDLPRWRSPSPMSSSIIPPPIVRSTYIAPPETLAQSVFIPKSSPFDERQHEIQADLQFLLDAQAEGLLRGFDAQSLDDQSSTGSTTPTLQSLRSSSARRARKPARRRLGTKSARKEIYKSILQLSSLKTEEEDDLQSQIREDDGVMDQLQNWARTREDLQKASQEAEAEEDTVRVQRLTQEADDLQVEINRVEFHLQQLRSKQRKILKQAAAVENRVKAKLASYSSSLRALENDVQKFLSIVPPGADRTTAQSGMEPSVWQLPPKRRNLEMAKDYWTEQRSDKQHQLESVQHEKTALQEGAALWREATLEINEFETWFRAEMVAASNSMSQSTSAWEDPALPDETANQQRRLLDRVTAVLASLEQKHRLSEERNWRLLIAALGAELDAMQRAKRILEQMLGVEATEPVEAEVRPEVSNGLGEGDEIHELDKSFQTARKVGSESSDTEDEPSPELMFSRKDTE